MEIDQSRHSMQEYNRLYAEENNIYRSYAKKIGMSEASFWIIYYLRESGDSLAQNSLIRTMSLPKQTVNSSLKKMEAEGILILSSVEDRRVKQVTLTQKGIDIATKAVDPVFIREYSAMDELDEQEQKQMINLFRRYRQALKNRMLE